MRVSCQTFVFLYFPEGRDESFSGVEKGRGVKEGNTEVISPS